MGGASEDGGGVGAAREPTWFQRRLPNALTIARVVMTVGFVAVLSVYRFPDVNGWALAVGLVLFVVAALTDALDGFLARRWDVVSVFGRIVDPLADKVLVLGAFVLLAGPGFRLENEGAWMRPFGQMSGVAPWMVIVILTRELLVTTLRGALEGRGIDFSAVRWGKLKMIIQSVAVPAILLLAIIAASMTEAGDLKIVEGAAAPTSFANDDAMIAYEIAKVAYVSNIVLAWLATVVTAISVVPYVTRAMAATRSARADD